MSRNKTASRSFLAIAAHNRMRGRRGMPARRTRPGSVCEKLGSTRILVVTANTPANRHPARMSVSACSAFPRWTDLHRYGVRLPPPRFGRVWRKKRPDPVTRSRRVGSMRLGPPAISRRKRESTGLKPPARMTVRAAARPSRGLERIGI